MNIISLLVFSSVFLLLAYRFYGRFLARTLGLRNENTTPAHTHRDNIDYVPSKTSVVLGHHFASIAGAGPIVGPIIAVAFGWIPALLWVLLGGIFFGAVHDLTSLVASLRHKGKSIGVVIETYIGIFGKKLFLIFSFTTLLLVIAVFTDIVAKTFVKVPSAASASIGFMALAMVFGWVLRRFTLSFWILSTLGVLMMYSFIYIGGLFPLNLSYTVWILILLAYIYLAAVTPVWLILQPRDYLNSYLLYGMMFFGILGVFVANPSIKMDSAISFEVESLGYLFPFLFVTIACGALSGFHSLVASGTTSKQIDKEENALAIGFGGMLIESLLAVLSISAVIVLSREDYFSRLTSVGPVTLFSEGLGGFISSLGVPLTIGISFVALTVSAFALTSLDTCTRLARFALQEYFETENISGANMLSENRHLSTLITVAISALLIVSGEFAVLWPIFGSANQLLGALALLAVTVWLFKKGINPWFTLIPMFFMFAVTLSSLIIFAWKNFGQQQYLLGVIALVLFILALVLLLLAKKSLSGLVHSKTETLAN
ncbi:MAG: carbon starvation protein A [Bacteroidetes bacterium]|nr:carbon starvation protein A [Bacteroidota bacterium]